MSKLGERMKEYKHELNPKVLPYLPFIIRLDGHKFSKFTRGLKCPFDDNFSQAMINNELSS